MDCFKAQSRCEDTGQKSVLWVKNVCADEPENNSTSGKKEQQVRGIQKTNTLL
jgi:hypothetical protein